MDSPHKLFISYSHKDEEQVDNLKSHLSTLQRKKQIESWHDRKIIPGTEWGEEINSHLADASIILFIVSSDFLHSDYCYNTEVAEAMKQHESGSSVVIPVVLRACDWNDTPFGKIQGAPKDAQPLTKWDDPDEYFLDVVQKIKMAITHHPRLQKPQQSTLGENLLTEEHTKYLNDTEIIFSHRHADKVTLDDIFVSPDLRLISEKIDRTAASIPGTSLTSVSGHYIVLGDEQSGKTTLTKRLYLEFLASGYRPILAKGKSLRSNNLDKVATNCIKEQYLIAPTVNDKKVLIVDDFCQSKSSKTDLHKLLETAKDSFEKVVIFAEDAFEFFAREIPDDHGFRLCQILPFSNKRRAELAERWLSIGVSEVGENENYFQDIDRLRRHIDQFIVSNSVPSRPVLLVSLLQSAEAAAPMRSEMTNYGHCYQYIIYQALDRAQIASSAIDSCFNYLTELAGLLRTLEKRSASLQQILDFRTAYKDRFIGGKDVEKIEKALISSGILKNEAGFVSFKYRYFFYFFSGKYVADGLVGGTVEKSEVNKLIQTLYKEESSNILIYITHHSKQPWVIEEIQLSLLELFEAEKPASLVPESLTYIKDFVASLPEIVMEQRDLHEERQKEYSKRDQAEIEEKENNDNLAELPPDDFLATINRLFKGIELTGQIVRNKYGSLEKETIRSLIRESYDATFRFLNYFIETTETIKAEIISCIEWMISSEDLDKDKVEKRAKGLFISLNYYLIFGTVIRIAESVGTRAAMSVCYEIDEEANTPAVSLVTIAMELQFLKKIDLERIKLVYKNNDKNPVVQRILKEIVVRHTYLHPVDYKIQQKLSEALTIPPERMRIASTNKAHHIS